MPWAYVSIESIDCILFSLFDFELKSILLIYLVLFYYAFHFQIFIEFLVLAYFFVQIFFDLL